MRKRAVIIIRAYGARIEADVSPDRTTVTATKPISEDVIEEYRATLPDATMAVKCAKRWAREIGQNNEQN